jgi:hypothetical protein
MSGNPVREVRALLRARRTVVRWRVERAGSGPEYLGGWVASNGDLGGVFPTWAAAMAFVERMLRREDRAPFSESLARLGMVATDRVDERPRLAWRTPPEPAIPPPFGRGRPLTPEQVSAIKGMRQIEGLSGGQIAKRLGIAQPTVSRYIRRNGW